MKVRAVLEKVSMYLAASYLCFLFRRRLEMNSGINSMEVTTAGSIVLKSTKLSKMQKAVMAIHATITDIFVNWICLASLRDVPALIP